MVGVVILASAIFLWLAYSKYAKLADQKLSEGPFPTSSVLYAAPQPVALGDPGTPLRFAARLRESGYVEDSHNNRNGWYHLRPDAIEVFPGPDSYTGSESGVIRFENGEISKIISLTDNSERTEYTLEPELLSSLFDKNREKRRLVKYDDIPPLLVHAVIAIEDKRFFQHSGFDPIRIVKAFLVDVKERRNAQGASTITQQLARNLWLDNGKRWSRKFAELMITLHLERKLTKQKIFEYYANQVDLGRRGTFAIRGFGEASQAYFGKDIRALSLDEAATLAGIVQQPSWRNPVRWPDRARSRRNVVLKAMLDNGYVTKSQFEAAIEPPVVTTKQGGQSTDAPYFVDMVNNQLMDQFQDHDFSGTGARVYTTLDPDLQRDAAEAIAIGMHEVDGYIARQRKQNPAVHDPQVALICIDPHTGEVKALIGGRNYGGSQLNHALSKRPSGSVFKPFVYAAALNTGLYDNPENKMTASSTFEDEPRTFSFSGTDYAPTDFHKDAWLGTVTMRTALAKSLNVPAVAVAEAAGYNTVANLAHQAGLADIRATPAEALGAYDVTPMDMAGAYSLFANRGTMVKPRLVLRVMDKGGEEVWNSKTETKQVLDPRVTFIMVNLLQEVLRTGTGANVRGRGFTLPAAGKTGTSHDAWFAGFTSKLLCIVWVGQDDYQDLKIEGAHAALPIWAEFMKRAHKHRAYRAVAEFDMPDGVVSSQIDPLSGELGTPSCPKLQAEYYLVGTQPVQFCHLHDGGIASEMGGWGTVPPTQTVTGTFPVLPPPRQMPGQNGVPAAPAGPASSAAGRQQTAMQQPAQPGVPGQPDQPGQTQDGQQKEKKKGLIDKLKGIFH